jgi:uncharacterized protein with HEPN domain
VEKDPAIYVRHILEAIDNIEADTAGYDFEKFRADRRTRQLVERNLEILSEASRRLPEELKAENLIPEFTPTCSEDRLDQDDPPLESLTSILDTRAEVG